MTMPPTRGNGGVRMVGAEKDVAVYGPELPAALQTVAPNEALIVGGSTPVLTQTPEVETTYVYANDTGVYYHLSDCKYVSNYSRKYELPVAYYNGYLPCQECGAPTYMPGGAQ